MERKRRRIIYGIATASSLCMFTLVIFFLSPSNPISFGFLSLSPLFLFFMFLMLTVYFISGLIMKTATHGILISVFVAVFFLLRLNNLHSPIFLILLLALFIVLEMLVSSKKPS